MEHTSVVAKGKQLIEQLTPPTSLMLLEFIVLKILAIDTLGGVKYNC